MCNYSKTITIVFLLIAACSSIVNAKYDFEFVKPSNGDTVYCGDSLTIQLRNKDGDRLESFFYMYSKNSSIPFFQPGTNSLFDFKADSIFTIYLPDSITPATYRLTIDISAMFALPAEREISLVIMKKPTNTQKRTSPSHSSLVPASSNRVVLFKQRNCLSGIRISSSSNQIFDLQGKFIEGSGPKIVPIKGKKQ